MRQRRINYHRKREGKTNYKKRLSLLQSRKDRLVIRKSNKYIIAQIVRYEPKGDKILATAHSKELQKLGWKNSCKNRPACYLTGLLLGKKALENNLKEAILDLGLQTPVHKSTLYTLVKGVVDAKLEVPASKDIFPEEDMIKGKNISEKIMKDFDTIKAKIKV